MEQTNSPDKIDKESLSYECATPENFSFYNDFYDFCNPAQGSDGVVDDDFVGEVEENWFDRLGSSVSNLFDEIKVKGKIGLGLIIALAVIILLILVKGFSSSLENGKFYEATASLLV